MKYFAFVDESGINDQEQLFLLGCLLVPTEKIGEYYDAVTRVQSQIFTKVKKREELLQKNLSDQELIKFLQGRRKPYEIKFRNINKNVVQEYRWLLSQYFKFPDVRYRCLVYDKNRFPYHERMKFFDQYVRELCMLIKNSVSVDDEVVLLPDDISFSGDENYEKVVNERLRVTGRNIFGTTRLQSHSNIFIQVTDVLTGSILSDVRSDDSHQAKQEIVKYVKGKTGLTSFKQNITSYHPNYFSIWHYNEPNNTKRK